jgi:mannose-6-phosphate isomerase-like protein (cupin superfamily)
MKPIGSGFCENARDHAQGADRAGHPAHGTAATPWNLRASQAFERLLRSRDTTGKTMKGFIDTIQERAKDNEDFRHVLYTGKHLQLVLMALKPQEEIGGEVHNVRDQFFRVEKGKGQIVIDGVIRKIKKDDAIVVPAGARHNLINSGKTPLKLSTLYGPPNHLDQLIQATRQEAAASKETFAGVTTE